MAHRTSSEYILDNVSDDDIVYVTTHPRFRRLDIRDPKRFVVVIVDRDGAEVLVAGEPRLIWIKSRDALDTAALPRIVRGTKRRLP